MADQDLKKEPEGRPCTACNFEPHGCLPTTGPRGSHPGTPLTPNATDRLYCGCLPRSAKCPALYGLAKAGIAHTSGRPLKSAGQSGTSCFEAPRRVNSTPCVLLFIMCRYHGLAFKRTRLRTAPAGWLRLSLKSLTGNFFGLFPFFSYHSLSYERIRRSMDSCGFVEWGKIIFVSH